MKYNAFPFLNEYADTTGYNKETLIKAYEIEAFYHEKLLNESSAVKRKDLYSELYNSILPLYAQGKKEEKNHLLDKEKLVTQFEKELSVGSVIDLGCGNGAFLKSIRKRFPQKRLVGVDVFKGDELNNDFEFIESDVITYRSSEKFDVIISDNVVEHLVPEDFETYLETAKELLSKQGKLILILPNKLFGPTDITRIVDFSYSGKITAKGGHVNESTYTQVVDTLSKHGFKKIKTVSPIPRLKYSSLKNLRISTKFIRIIEQSPFILKCFRMLKVNGKCPIRFTITVVCEKDANPA